MDDTLYHLCHENGNGELELISSHATHEEAYEEKNAQWRTMTNPCSLVVMCIAELEREVSNGTWQQCGIRKRISKRRNQLRECQREKAILRRLLGELPREAYIPLTDKFIKLTDLIEEHERYIKNGLHRMKRYSSWIDNNKKSLAFLRAAICAAMTANKEAIDIMEKRSLAYTSSIAGDDKPGDDSEID